MPMLTNTPVPIIDPRPIIIALEPAVLLQSMMFELTLVSPWKNKRRRATRDRVGLAPNFNTVTDYAIAPTLHPDPARKVGNLNT